MRRGGRWACLAGGALLLGAAYAATRIAPLRGAAAGAPEATVPSAASTPVPAPAPTSRAASAPASARASAPAALNVSAYERHLRSLGLTGREVKQLVLARLEAHVAPSVEPSRYRYWRRDGGDGFAEARQRFRAAEAVRAGLLRIFGAGAVNDPVLQRLFRPLDDRLEFLTSAEQLAIQEARIELARTAQQTGAGLVSMPLEYRPEWQDVLASMLDEELLLEYALRESALAEQLRNAPVELSEAEFRETFSVLAELEDTPDVETLRRARSRLRTLLGADRFDRLWGTRDPVYAVVRELMEKRGAREETIRAVYGVINAAQDAFANAAALADRDSVRAMEAAREAAASEERQIAALVGAELARQVVTARAQALLEMSQRGALPQ